MLGPPGCEENLTNVIQTKAGRQIKLLHSFIFSSKKNHNVSQKNFNRKSCFVNSGTNET